MYDFETTEKLFGDLESYLIYQKEEIKRIKNEIKNRRLANS